MTRGAFWTSQPVKTPTARAAVVTLLVVSGLLSGCSGGGAVRPDPLPFHVAVVPGPLTASRSDEIFRPESPEEVAEGSLALDFERDSSESSESFFAALVEALDEDVFAQATLLDLPPAHAAIDEGERDRDAIRQSQRQEADVGADRGLRGEQ